jgi:hypothetical protein
MTTPKIDQFVAGATMGIAGALSSRTALAAINKVATAMAIATNKTTAWLRLHGKAGQ